MTKKKYTLEQIAKIIEGMGIKEQDIKWGSPEIIYQHGYDKAISDVVNKLRGK